MQVIVAIWLHPDYVQEIFQKFEGEPGKVSREDVRGTYKVRLPRSAATAARHAAHFASCTGIA